MSNLLGKTKIFTICCHIIEHIFHIVYDGVFIMKKCHIAFDLDFRFLYRKWNVAFKRNNIMNECKSMERVSNASSWINWCVHKVLNWIHRHDNKTIKKKEQQQHQETLFRWFCLFPVQLLLKFYDLFGCSSVECIGIQTPAFTLTQTSPYRLTRIQTDRKRHKFSLCTDCRHHSGKVLCAFFFSFRFVSFSLSPFVSNHKRFETEFCIHIYLYTLPEHEAKWPC